MVTKKAEENSLNERCDGNSCGPEKRGRASEKPLRADEAEAAESPVARGTERFDARVTSECLPTVLQF